MRGYIATVLFLLLGATRGAVVAPPWARNGTEEPCGDWQEVRWPADGRCYRIFRQGPCPETLELGFGEKEAECRCPPRTAQWARDARCHSIYRRGPCAIGSYFTPVMNTRWGACVDPQLTCPPGQLYWPRDEGKCYPRLTRGPCPIGELLIEEEEQSVLGVCRCDSGPELKKFRWITNSNACYEPYTRGPCGKGELVLPRPLRCGCQKDLPQYHNASQDCHELGSVGPCPAGHQFIQNSENSVAMCECKENHVMWPATGACYRAYTRGPCPSSQLLIPSDKEQRAMCVPLPCSRGFLYFPEDGHCYRAGTQGPCPAGKLVVFEEFVGASYSGRCGCSKRDFPSLAWDSGSECYEVGVRGPCPRGHVFGPGGTCHTLYTRGYCASQGQWLVPEGVNSARCECRPGYSSGGTSGDDPCQAPLVALARFLSNAR